jgi:hypothetical protein
MHYKLFTFDNDKHPPTDRLQEAAKILYQWQPSMLNNRSVFASLQVGNSNDASLLSFRWFDPASNANMTLRERIMSQLHDDWPGLDPFLNKYILQFMIPDAEFFLRMIRCPNVLALREPSWLRSTGTFYKGRQEQVQNTVWMCGSVIMKVNTVSEQTPTSTRYWVFYPT